MAKSPHIYLDHIDQALANIEADLDGHNFESFRADRRTRQLIERNLEILSEASRRIPEAAKAKEKEIPWKAIAGIGNVLRHDYHESHPTILWETCQKDLAPLKEAIRRIRKELERKRDKGRTRNGS